MTHLEAPCVSEGLDQCIQMAARMLSNALAGQHVYSQARQEVGRGESSDSSQGCGWGSPEQEVSMESILAHCPTQPWEMGPGDLGAKEWTLTAQAKTAGFPTREVFFLSALLARPTSLSVRRTTGRGWDGCRRKEGETKIAQNRRKPCRKR